ncbi:vanin-like protein 1 [Lasioglossum baleicum]|uniref:vanin-like protein 1 n=1 Tax=Lasioglossum baleicum TaxID=434251 RepID=UPI003FCCB85B
MRVAVGPLGLLLLLTLVQFSQQVTELDQKDYYVGAVVEFAPFVNAKNGLATLQTNVNNYTDFAKQAKQQGADIIVFPEDGLTSYHMPAKSEMDPWTTAIPSPKEEYVPCTGNRNDVSQTLKQLSCAALTNSIYLVANIAEKACPNAHNVECTDSRTIYHNTNVAFDRNGKIIARYRKVNLYNEEQFEVVNPPEIVTFDTDFGVKFGTFICFDILFPVPALNLTRQLGVTDIVYSTAWFSEAPFLTAVQTQYGWSYGEDVNMLAAGYNNPRAGSAGSGIYLGTKGIANATITEKSQSRLLVSRVPKKTPVAHPDVLSSPEKDPSSDKIADSCYRMNGTTDVVLGVRIMRDSIQSFETVPLNETSFNKTVCHRDFCCNFRGSKAADINEASSIYRAVVFNGCRFYGHTVEADIRVCALTQCSDESVASCGVVKPSKVTFKNIEITTTDRISTRVLALPSALNSSLLPFERWTYSKEWLTTENATRYTITLKEPTSDISTFGIYIRDLQKLSNGSAELFSLSTIILPILMSTICLLANRR